MKYIVFAGDAYYPQGGWKDWAAEFDTEAEAVAYARGRTAGALTWAHVYVAGRGIIFEKKGGE